MAWRFVFVVMLLALTTAQPPQSQGAETAREGTARVYQLYCSVCHGERGNGKSRAAGTLVPPPRDFTTTRAAGELTRARMIASIRDGRPGTAMVGWKAQLTERRIGALADYIRDRFMLPVAYDTSNEGRRVYAEYCSVCHGDRGDGNTRAAPGMNPRPRDFTAAPARRDLTPERMVFAITYGRPNTAMPGWGTQLKKGQIAAVADYIRRNFIKTEPGAKPNHSLAPQTAANRAVSVPGGHTHQHQGEDPAAFFARSFPKGLKGNFQTGGKLYGSNCVPCHGEKGDGQGPRAFFILPKPRDFRHPAARASLNRPHLFEGIAKGTLGSEMPAWDKVLSPQQIADIGEFVLRTFIRPAPQAAPAKGHRQPHSPGPEAHTPP